MLILLLQVSNFVLKLQKLHVFMLVRSEKAKPTTTRFNPIYLRAGGSTISYIFIPGPKHPLANKLFDIFGVNHGVERLWPIPWHVA
jgi:hypothetical protein